MIDRRLAGALLVCGNLFLGCGTPSTMGGGDGGPADQSVIPADILPGFFDQAVNADQTVARDQSATIDQSTVPDLQLVNAFPDLRGADLTAHFPDLAIAGDLKNADLADSNAKDQAAMALAIAECNLVSQCEGFIFNFLVTDPSMCAGRLFLIFRPTLDLPSSGTTASSAMACAQALPSTSCNDLFLGKVPTACGPMPGALADGAICGDDSQCASASCSRPSGNCGTCEPHPVLGGSCGLADGGTSSYNCGPGLGCNASHTCVALRDIGMTCDTDLPCGTGSCFNGICTADITTAGATCDSSRVTTPGCNLYASGLICLGKFTDAGVGPTTCEPFQLAPANGDCGVVNGDYVGCIGGGQCVNSKCVAPVDQGSACDQINGPPCLWPTSCINGVCAIFDLSTCH